MLKLSMDHPAPVLVRNRPTKWPIDKLRVGESFFVERAPDQVRSPWFKMAKRCGFKIVTRKTTENGVRGVRVWRVS